MGNRYRKRPSVATKMIATDEHSRQAIVEAVREWYVANRGWARSDCWERIGEDHQDVVTILQWRLAASQVIAKVCSVLGEVTTPVAWTPHVPLAATDGETIMLGDQWFHEHMIPAILEHNAGSTAYHWGEFKALAYHELSHIIWTPRFTQKPVSDLKKCDDSYACLKAFNILEDQRIESLFVARYAPSIPLFTHIVSKHIVDNGDRSTEFLLTHGRRYLPTKVRDLCRQNFAENFGEHLTEEFERVIDEYRTLVFPNDHVRAFDLTCWFVELAKKCGIWIPEHDSGAHNGHNKGRPEPVADQRRDQEARERADQRQADADADDDADGGADGESGNGDGADGGEDGGDDATGSGSTDGDGEHGAADDGDEDDDAGANTGNPVAGAFKQLAEQTEDKVLEDGRNALKAVSKTIADIGGAASVPNYPDTRNATVNQTKPWMNIGTKRLQESIGRIFNDYEERWVSGQSSGRLSVTDAMNARGSHFDVFDTFQDSDEEATSFEVVILLDRSGSMGRRSVSDFSDKMYTPEEWKDTFITLSTLAYEAMWTIRYAFQSLDIPVTVIGYDDSPTLISAPWTEPATRGKYVQLPDMGSTVPNGALRWAKSVLTSSDAKNRLLITLTDGEWYCDDSTISLVDDIRNIGGQTLLVAITPGAIGGTDEQNKQFNEGQRPKIEPDAAGRHYGHDEYITLTGLEMKRLPDEVGERIARLSQAVLTV